MTVHRALAILLLRNNMYSDDPKLRPGRYLIMPRFNRPTIITSREGHPIIIWAFCDDPDRGRFYMWLTLNTLGNRCLGPDFQSLEMYARQNAYLRRYN